MEFRNGPVASVVLGEDGDRQRDQQPGRLRTGALRTALSGRAYVLPRAATGEHRPGQPIQAWRAATLQLTGGPHSSAVFFSQFLLIPNENSLRKIATN
jgi:hypothetical protein